MRCMKLVHFVVHSFKDFVEEMFGGFYPPSSIHLDLSKTPLNAQFNECSIVDSDDMWTYISQHHYDVDENGDVLHDFDCSPQYIALGQYRRLLDFKEEDLDPKTALVDIEPQPLPLWKIWSVYHCAQFFSDFMCILDIYDRQLRLEFGNWLADNEAAKSYCGRNLFCMKTDSFVEWALFMKTMQQLMHPLVEKMKAGKYILNGKSIMDDRYHKRTPGFLCERLTAFWLAKKSGLRLKSMPVKQVAMDSPYQRTGDGQALHRQQ